jgi:hypothetical protein
MHVSVKYKILAHLANLAPGVIITSQSLIHLGPRGALDMALSRLNSKKRIKRKAWGLYINTPDGEDYHIDSQTIAEAKAQAFNKTVLPFGKTIAHLLKFPHKMPYSDTESSPKTAADTTPGAALNIGNETPLEDNVSALATSAKLQERKHPPAIKAQEKVLKFYGTGSSVNVRDLDNSLRIKCIPLSPKKARNYPMEGCYWVNAARYMGREYFYKNWKVLLDKVPPFRSTLNKMRDSFELMPEWLYSNLCINWLSGQNKRKHQLIEIPERVDNVPRKHLDIIWGLGFKEKEEISKIKF